MLVLTVKHEGSIYIEDQKVTIYLLEDEDGDPIWDEVWVEVPESEVQSAN